MSLVLILSIVVASLTFLTAVLKISPFIAFIIVSILAGFLLQMPPLAIVLSVQKGVGDMLGSIIITLAAGAMIGKLVAQSGAATVIANEVMKRCGEKYLSWGLMLTGLIIGIPLFYNVGFVLVIPIVFSLVYRFKLPVVQVAIPVLASLSVAHSLLPPHPSPASLVGLFQASMGKTFLYGILVAIPAVVVAGPLFSKTLKRMQPQPSMFTFEKATFSETLPSFGISVFSALLPVFLLLLTFLLSLLLKGNEAVMPMLVFLKEPSIVMLLSLIMVSLTLGLKQGMTVKKIMTTYDEGVREIAPIVLIIGASGGLKQIMIDSQVSSHIAGAFQSLQLHPLVLAWLVAAVIRVFLGSATVAGLTAAGILAPIVSQLHVDVNLLILAIGAGSIFCSHVNDTGFWMFKEYLNVSVKETFLSWSLMETIVSVVGLLGVLLLSLFM
jgi:Gnt-I system high-affinity gluconate transporter